MCVWGAQPPGRELPEGSPAVREGPMHVRLWVQGASGHSPAGGDTPFSSHKEWTPKGWQGQGAPRASSRLLLP